MVQPLSAGCAKDDSIEIIKRQSYGVLKILMYNSVLSQRKDSFFNYVRSVCFVQRNYSVCVEPIYPTEQICPVCYSVVLVRYTVSVTMFALSEKRLKEKPPLLRRKGWTDKTPMRRIGLIRHLCRRYY